MNLFVFSKQQLPLQRNSKAVMVGVFVRRVDVRKRPKAKDAIRISKSATSKQNLNARSVRFDRQCKVQTNDRMIILTARMNNVRCRSMHKTETLTLKITSGSLN